jgi:hypothetical protein
VKARLLFAVTLLALLALNVLAFAVVMWARRS